MGTPIRQVRIPEEIWDNIPGDNKSIYIREALQVYIQGNVQQTHSNNTDQQAIIDSLKEQIERLEKDVDYHRTQYLISLPFWKRWLVKRLMPPKNTEK